MFSRVTPCDAGGRHTWGPVRLWNRFAVEIDEDDESLADLEFASAACTRCGRLAIDCYGEQRRGQLDIASA